MDWSANRSVQSGCRQGLRGCTLAMVVCKLGEKLENIWRLTTGCSDLYSDCTRGLMVNNDGWEIGLMVRSASSWARLASTWDSSDCIVDFRACIEDFHQHKREKLANS